MQNKKYIKYILIFFLFVMYFTLQNVMPALSSTYAADTATGRNDENILLNEYSNHFSRVRYEKDITKNGFQVAKAHVSKIDHAVLGRLTLVPAISKDCHRLALFFLRKSGSVAIKTDDLINNAWLTGRARQTNRDIFCVAFCDLNADGLDDIILISTCQNNFGLYAHKTYHIADVLFQDKKGFYRDPRISDKINRFDMNKTHRAVISFLRDGISTEFLFTAKNLDALLANGFKPVRSQCFTERFEKFGVVDVIPGFFNIAGQNYLMVYIIDKKGNVLWNFQTMHDYVNFYEICAISFRDIDGDGNKDFLLIARYVTYDGNGTAVIQKDYDIFYQRAGYFLEDTNFKKSYPCRENSNISVITKMARRHWRWS